MQQGKYGQPEPIGGGASGGGAGAVGTGSAQTSYKDRLKTKEKQQAGELPPDMVSIS